MSEMDLPRVGPVSSQRAPAREPRANTATGMACFDTAIGRCGIAWSGRGVAGVQLPEAHDGATRALLAQRFPGATECEPPVAVAQAIDALQAALRGEPDRLHDIELDLHGVPPFEREVYAAARRIPCGSTLTYGELARQIGAPGAARAVGQALGRNPFAPVVPCHRVLGAGGRPGGFSAHGGLATKLRLLEIEGAAGFGKGGLFGSGDAMGA